MLPQGSLSPCRCSAFSLCLSRVLAHAFFSNHSLLRFSLSSLCVARPSSRSHCFSPHSPPGTDACRRPPLAHTPKTIKKDFSARSHSPVSRFCRFARELTGYAVLSFRGRTRGATACAYQRPLASARVSNIYTRSLSHSFSLHVRLSLFTRRQLSSRISVHLLAPVLMLVPIIGERMEGEIENRALRSSYLTSYIGTRIEREIRGKSQNTTLNFIQEKALWP